MYVPAEVLFTLNHSQRFLKLPSSKAQACLGLRRLDGQQHGQRSEVLSLTALGSTQVYINKWGSHPQAREEFAFLAYAWDSLRRGWIYETKKGVIVISRDMER